jgi:hypothetical protein
MKAQILTRHTATFDPQTKRCLISITPYLRPECLARGELTFAIWQCWASEGEAKIAETDAKAIQSARKALAMIADEAGVE